MNLWDWLRQLGRGGAQLSAVDIVPSGSALDEDITLEISGEEIEALRAQSRLRSGNADVPSHNS